jgi:hypothetical protein
MSKKKTVASHEGTPQPQRPAPRNEANPTDERLAYSAEMRRAEQIAELRQLVAESHADLPQTQEMTTATAVVSSITLKMFDAVNRGDAITAAKIAWICGGAFARFGLAGPVGIGQASLRALSEARYVRDKKLAAERLEKATLIARHYLANKENLRKACDEASRERGIPEKTLYQWARQAHNNELIFEQVGLMMSSRT